MDRNTDVLQMILDRLPTSISLVQGPQARLLLANRAATEVWGAEWKPGQAMQKFLTQHQIRVTRTDGQPVAFEHLAVIRAVRQGEAIHYQQEVIRRPDGALFQSEKHVGSTFFLTLPYTEAERLSPAVGAERDG